MILYCAVLLYVHVYSVPSLLLLSLGAPRACFASREEKEEEESYLDAP